MEQMSLWQYAARKGVILGAILGVSTLFENWMQFSGSISWYTLLAIEFLVVAVFHYIYLHRAVRERARLAPVDEGFSFGAGWSVAVAVSACAGVIVGAVQAIWLHVIIGYSTYIERMMTKMVSFMQDFGDPSMKSIYVNWMRQIQEAPSPSILSTFWGSIFSTILFGAIFGLIMAGVCSREARPFDTPEQE